MRRFQIHHPKPAEPALTPDQRREIIQTTLKSRGMCDKDLELTMLINELESSGSRFLHPPAARKHRLTVSGDFQFTDGSSRDVIERLKTSEPHTVDQMRHLGKDHPFTQAVSMQNLMTYNRQSLRLGLDREPTDTEMYAAHFLGSKAAMRVFTASDNTPMSSLVSPNCVANNPRALKGKTVGGFKEFLAERIVGVHHEELARKSIADAFSKYLDQPASPHFSAPALDLPISTELAAPAGLPVTHPPAKRRH